MTNRHGMKSIGYDYKPAMVSKPYNSRGLFVDIRTIVFRTPELRVKTGSIFISGRQDQNINTNSELIRVFIDVS